MRSTPLAALALFTAMTAGAQIAEPPAAAVTPGDGGGRNPIVTVGPTTTAPKAVARRSAKPYAPITAPQAAEDIVEFDMFVGESRVLPAPGVARIAVGNGALMSAAALDGKEIIVFANAPGATSLFVWNEQGQHQKLKINIQAADMGRFTREVAAFLATIPNAKASVIGAHIIVEGEQIADADLLKIEELAKRYPQIVNFTNRVGWEQMIALDVKVVEFPTSLLTEMGLRWTPTGGLAMGAIWSPIRRGGGGYKIELRTGGDAAPPISAAVDGAPLLLPSGLNVMSMLNMGLNAQLALLAQEGQATLLAQPQLTARSGSRASFIAGGEIPYAVGTRDGIVVQFKDYGVKLDIVPRADREGAIRAEVRAEVSSLDRSIIVAGVPGLLTRRTNTEFNVRPGETIVLSGLLQRESTTDVDKVPFLGDLPILGHLFRSKRFNSRETELVFFVTPTLIDARSESNVRTIRRTEERLARNLGPATGDALATDEPTLVEPAPIEAAPAELAPPAALAPPPEAAAVEPPPALISPQAWREARSARPYEVRSGPVALRAAPNAGAATVATLSQGQTVFVATLQAQGNWLPVLRQVGTTIQRGWVPAASITPLPRGDALKGQP